jgi:rubredoxin|tara:strand:- start:831 stop:977 length:147 start_codon:yes stop_codon:yes gene_type:complete
MKEGKCKHCGLIFTEEDYKNASKGIVGDECLVGDYDDICYPCQFLYGY